MTVKHWADKTRTPRCGAGWYWGRDRNLPTTDKAQVTCKRCLHWMEYDKKKEATM